MKRTFVKYSIPALLLLGTTALSATTVKDVVQHTLVNNPEIQSSLKNDEAFKLYVDEAEGAYLPQINLTAEATKKRTKTDPDNPTAANTDSNQDGYQGRIDLEQLIYDGGATLGNIDEQEFKYTSNKFANDNLRNEAILESISAYLNLAKYDERMKLAQANLATYEEYFKTAQETEEINGEALDRVQSSAKIYLARTNFADEKANSEQAASTFEKSVGIEPDGVYCRPNIKKDLIGTDLKALIENALNANPEILEQVENIKEQRELLNQADASYYPTLAFKAQALGDKDLITDEEETNVYTGKIELTYNLFAGGSDKSASEREKLFLLEAQDTLDTVTKDVVDRLKASYITYMNSMNKIDDLKGFITDNKQIVEIYQDQFEAGTRTFIDLLNVEGDLYNSELSLTNAQYDMYQSYYEILTYLSVLQDGVMQEENQMCGKEAMPAKAEAKPEVDEDLTAMMAEEKPMTGTIMGDLEKEFASEIASGEVMISKDYNMFQITRPQAKGANLFHEGYVQNLEEFVPRMVKVLSKYKDQITEVQVNGHASSNFAAKGTATEKFVENKRVSLNRANAMIAKTIALKDQTILDNYDWIKQTFKPYGKSSSETIKKADGTEDRLASKRVEFVIVN